MTDESMTEYDAEPTPQPGANQLVKRGFDGVTLAGENAATQALIAKATADIQARWVMAMRRPRDLHNVRQLLIAECRRPGFAKAAIYAIPRGGKVIKGLSIRFAEVAMRCMGNLNAEAITLYDSAEERVIRVSVADLESNSTWSRDITVKKTIERKQLARGQRPIRTRTNSYGDEVFIVEATDDDVAMKEASAISKASRTGILRLIPGHFQDEAKAVCERTAQDAAAKNPDAERNALFDAYATLSIMPTSLAEYLGHPVEQATPAEIVELRFLYAGLRDGQTNWGEVMKNAEEVRAQMKTKAGQPVPIAAAAQAPAADKKPAISGKGASAVKEKIASAKAEPKTSVEPSPDIKPDPRDRPDAELIEMPCSSCGVPLLGPAALRGSIRCEACAAS